jgi:hypothetical protein
MNDELERLLKEAAIVKLWCSPSICVGGGMKKTTKNASQNTWWLS